MTQEFPANEASARAYTVGKKLSVLPKKDLSSDCPPLPRNDLTQMNTECLALHSTFPIRAPHNMTLCFCLSWGDGLVLRNIALWGAADLRWSPVHIVVCAKSFAIRQSVMRQLRATDGKDWPKVTS